MNADVEVSLFFDQTLIAVSAILAELQEMHLEKTSAKDPNMPFEKSQLAALSCVEDFCREFKVLI